MREAWPTLDAMGRKHHLDFGCGQKLCRLHKHVLRECGAAEYGSMM